jgi:hypothetical protein
VRASRRSRRRYGILRVYMTQQLKEIIERVKRWREWRQEDAAYLLEMMEESGTTIHRLSDEQREAVREGLESPVVSDAEVKAFRNRRRA